MADFLHSHSNAPQFRGFNSEFFGIFARIDDLLTLQHQENDFEVITLRSLQYDDEGFATVASMPFYHTRCFLQPHAHLF